MKTCRHNFKVVSITGNVLNFRCMKCKEKFDRGMTTEEWNAYTEDMEKPSEIHRIYHDLRKKIKFKKIKGYALINKMDKWMENHPSVKRVIVDDSYHTTSCLYFIPHEDEYHYHGTTVVFVPQCSGEPATSFFLYPSAVKSMMDTLKYFQSLASKKRKKKVEIWWKAKP